MFVLSISICKIDFSFCFKLSVRIVLLYVSLSSVFGFCRALTDFIHIFHMTPASNRIEKMRCNIHIYKNTMYKAVVSCLKVVANLA